QLAVREAFTWHRLYHVNIVPFLGIADYAKICPGGSTQLCLVSPWLPDGDIMEYLKTNPAVSPFPLLVDILDGVEYLHSHASGPIIHGDLKANNILLDFRVIRARPTARLIDFGLSRIMEVDMPGGVSRSSSADKGNARWLAFERLRPGQYRLQQSETRTTMSDVFEVMRTFFEILTGGCPFQGKTEIEALLQALDGANPERPLNCYWIDDERWNLMLECWSQDRDTRPSLDTLREDLKQSIWIDRLLVCSSSCHINAK
ncbi:kinase-like protein, partial [Calocera viscosa TUFC12733]